MRETLIQGTLNPKLEENFTWPYKLSAEMDGDITLGGLHMIHERSYVRTCGPIMAQGGIQAMETMMFTIDHINRQPWWIPKVTLGRYTVWKNEKFTLIEKIFREINFAFTNFFVKNG